MLQFLERLFSADYVPHGYCMRWDPATIWLHVVSDTLTALAYFVIPFALVYFVRRRRDLAFHWMFIAFGLFILACGATHLMAVYTLWRPVYRLDGLLKGITALASIPTAFLLVRLVPRALALPSPDDLRREINRRALAEDQLRTLNAELELRVRQRTDSLQRSNQALERVAYISSHDLREPLRTVALYSQLIEKQAGVTIDGEHKANLRVIGDATRRMHSLIEDLLEYTETVTRGEHLAVSSVSLAGAAADSLHNLKPLPDGAQIVMPPSHQWPLVKGNETQLRQLFQNLFANAFKYARPGVAPLITVSVAEQGPWVETSVTDNGIGLNMEYSSLIFEAFKRLHGRQIPGTGVGLAICKSIVESFGGKIWVESEGDGKGTTFRFTLPKAT